MTKRIALGADHAGFHLKDDLKEELALMGMEAVDFGTHSKEPVDYPDIANRVCDAVLKGGATYGVLICGSGIGMSIAANRHPGVRAANCLDERMASLAREHNDANVLCLGSRLLDADQAKKVVWAFLETPFGGGRHGRRVEKIEVGGAEARA